MSQIKSNRMKLLLENYVEAKKLGSENGYDLCPVEENNYEKYYILIQPKNGVYKGHSYVLEMQTTYGTDRSKYPIDPPYVHFVTNIFHTNISTGGSICVDILKEKSKWMPTYTFNAIIQNILLLFEEPNTASPYNCDASKLWTECESKYVSLVKKNKLTVREVSIIHAECFEEFSNKAKSIETKNNLESYKTYFPQLFPLDDNYIAIKSKIRDDFASVETLIHSMNVRKANHDEDGKPKGNGEDGKPKKNKWQRYQK